MNNKWSGSFLGFTINGIHSSQLGIVRTYDKEYELKQASFSDETQEREGRDGEDWYGTLLGNKEIPISFAYYGLTEYQLSQIKKLFNIKKPIPLILDEEPHKTWMVYSGSGATRSYIGFEMNGDRYYNGDGQVTFVSHSPYAKCELLCEEDYTEDSLLNREQFITSIIEDDTFSAILSTVSTDEQKVLSSLISKIETIDSNLEEWKNAINLPHQNEQFSIDESGIATYYNPGDVAVGFKIYFKTLDYDQTIILKKLEEEKEVILFIPKDAKESYWCIDFYDNLVYGCDDFFNKSGESLYNNYLIKDEFFLLDVGKTQIQCLSFSYEQDYNNWEVGPILEGKYLEGNDPINALDYEGWHFQANEYESRFTIFENGRTDDYKKEKELIYDVLGSNAFKDSAMNWGDNTDTLYDLLSSLVGSKLEGLEHCCLVFSVSIKLPEYGETRDGLGHEYSSLPVSNWRIRSSALRTSANQWGQSSRSVLNLFRIAESKGPEEIGRIIITLPNTDTKIVAILPRFEQGENKWVDIKVILNFQKKEQAVVVKFGNQTYSEIVPLYAPGGYLEESEIYYEPGQMSMQEWLMGTTNGKLNVWLRRTQEKDKNKYIGMCMDNFSVSVVKIPDKIDMYYLFS